MLRLNSSGTVALGAMAAAMFSLGISLVALACGPERSAHIGSRPHGAATATTMATASMPRDAKANPSPSPARSAATPRVNVPVTASAGITVKRFAVTSAVHEREPVAGGAPLRSDGKPIYAFAELANAENTAQKILITFQRNGAPERVGNVNLMVPANSARFRTWGHTRLVREAGTWQAVLWSKDGSELARATFEVEEGDKASIPLASPALGAPKESS